MVQLFFRPNVRMGKKCDLREFDRGMTVSARRGGLRISGNADLLGFACRTDSRFCIQKTKKTSSEQQFCGQKHVVNETTRLMEADRKVRVTQITTHE